MEARDGKERTMLQRRYMPVMRLLHLHLHRGFEKGINSRSKKAANKSIELNWSMRKEFSIIANVLFRRNYFFIFLVSGLLYGIIYAVMTNLIDVRFGLKYINYSFTIVSIIFVVLFSILGGILISLQVFAIRNRQKSLKSANIGFIGALLSFFNTTCPFCKPLLLSLIGFSGSLAILKFGLALAIFSLILLIVSIYLVTSHLSHFTYK